MAWCRQATRHYLNQCWPRSLPPYGVTRPQWVKTVKEASGRAVMWNSNVHCFVPDKWADLKVDLSNVELWCFLGCHSEQTVEQTFDLPVISDGEIRCVMWSPCSVILLCVLLLAQSGAHVNIHEGGSPYQLDKCGIVCLIYGHGYIMTPHGVLWDVITYTRPG